MPYTPPPGYYPQYYQPQGYMDQLAQLKAAQQPYTPQIMPPQVNANTGSTPILWVQGEAGAKSYLVAPNTTVLLMDSECERFYIKSTDQNGMPTMRTYAYNEVTAQPVAPVQTPPPDYVSHAELNTLREELTEEIHKITATVSKNATVRKGAISTDE